MVKFIQSFGFLAVCLLFSAVKADDESPINPQDIINACTNGHAPCVNMVHIRGPGSIQADDNSMVRGSNDDGNQLTVAFKENAKATFFCGNGAKTTITFTNGSGTLSAAPPMSWTWYAEPQNKGLTGQHHNPMLHFVCGV